MVTIQARANSALARPGEHMRQRITDFPKDALRAWELGQSWPIPPALRAPRRVVVCGMGGSAIGADFLRAAVRHAVPLEVVRDYTLPPCDADTLIIASSFSGNTEETIAALQSPEAAPAAKVIVSTGGRLTTLAAELGAFVMTYECEGPPRTAWEFGFLPVLAVLGRLGVLKDSPADVLAALHSLEAQATVLQTFAAALAPQLGERIPFVVGAEHLAPVARRWACQFNENSKRVAFFGEVPEVNHNFLLGLTDGRTGSIMAVLLDSELSSGRARKRLDLMERLLQDRGVTYERVLIPGASELDAMLRGALIGDWLSWELAIAEGVDPSDTSALERFKTDLVAVPAPH